MKPRCSFCDQDMDAKALTEGSRWCTPCHRPCKTCGRQKGDHTICPVCGDALEHGHDKERIELEWEGRARMAAAKRQSGGELNDLDREAVERYPNPRFLALGGYR